MIPNRFSTLRRYWDGIGGELVYIDILHTILIEEWLINGDRKDHVSYGPFEEVYFDY